MEELKASFKKDTREFFSERIEYDSAHCLLIKWAANDFNVEVQQRFTNEFEKVKQLFEKDLQIFPTLFEIPDDDDKAQQALNSEIVAFVGQHSTKARTLIVIYYAGHGDRDSNGRAEWMA